MARIRSSGSVFGSLDERQRSLAQVISALGFHPLTKPQEKSFRGTLSIAIGQWMMAEGTGSTAGLTVKGLNSSLRRLARDLESAARLLSAVSPGIHPNHDIEIAMRVAEVLRQHPTFKSPAEVHAALARFTEDASLFAQSALVAAKLLETTPSRPGRVRQDWHKTFIKAVTYLCRLNAVPTTITTGRVDGKPVGRILDVMQALEPLLPKGMRAPSMTARVQRLYRSKRKAKRAK